MTITETIEKVLKEKGFEYRLIPLPENLAPDVLSHAAFHRIKLANAMTTILYKTEKGIIAVVKRADTKVNEANVKAVAGVKELVFAKKEDLDTLGVETGMVPYLGLPIPFYVDEKVLAVGKGYGTAGTKLLGMAMGVKDMVKANEGTVGDFADLEMTIDLSKKKYRIVSGITPSGDGSLHIGNYLGAVKQFVNIAKRSECFLFVADYHALTTIQDKKQLQHNVETLVLNELALLQGFLTEEEFGKIIFYRQTDINGLHTELQSVLNNVTPLGLLKRAHAYKDKLAKDVMEDDINVGLFSYPMLMAADILLYKPDLVPVGKDQKQHVEITRDIAGRFNKIFPRDKQQETRDKGVFKLPEPYIPEEVATVLGTDGKRKMSKTLGNIISIFESEDVIRKQVNGVFTDPTRKHATDPGHIEGNMVFAYLEHFGDKEQVTRYKEDYKAGKVGDVEVKEYLFDSLMKTFGPARAKYTDLVAHPEKVRKILETGAARANAVAGATMREVREAVGLTNRYSIGGNKGQGTGDKGSLDKLGMTDGEVTISQFAAMELRVGLVTEARNAEGSEKLIRLTVSFNAEEAADSGQARMTQGREMNFAITRVIFTGVRPFGYTPEYFQGKKFLFIVNLAPRKMMNEYSQGMILAVDGDDGKPKFIEAPEEAPVGSRVR